MTEPFCGDCNRIRLTAEGMLRTCLFSLHETDLRAPLRDGASDDELEQIVRDAVWRKELKHHVGEPGFRQPPRSHVAHRRVSPLEVGEAWARVAAACAPLPAERVALRGARPGGRGGGRRQRGRPAAVRPLGDGRLRACARPTPTRRLPLALAGEVAAGEVARRARSRPGRRSGITTGAAVPPGADAILRVEDSRRRRRPRHARRRRCAGPARPLPRRGRRAAATCSRRPARG